ncbi:DUF5683 domain-containing protein [Ferruginibacter lapsinanis]|uniref:DUF5683 domain-containing protein n=1 Tax=Ferruginibacter lapsinanis TaxID=563172 RepID=UPI001E3C2324|nr:DUF5683 domain-containing protein [Ferruginibacter lapsinanis]UEG48640.1 DUF5683 domain-containing protein [Ferruginibacter lapsinanis]
MQKFFFILFSFCFFSLLSFSQTKKDSTIAIVKKIPDTTKNKFNPRTATIRSAIIPGWGQIYNKKYWKLPLVYGALGTTAGVFSYNVKNYNRLKKAYILKTDNDPSNDGQVYVKFQNLSAESIRSYRNEFRQNVDYSVLFFVIFWGLNVVDATVDAHLKAFDVNDDLSLELRPGYSPLANTSGVSLVLNIGK